MAGLGSLDYDPRIPLSLRVSGRRDPVGFVLRWIPLGQSGGWAGGDGLDGREAVSA